MNQKGVDWSLCSCLWTAMLYSPLQGPRTASAGPGAVSWLLRGLLDRRAPRTAPDSPAAPCPCWAECFSPSGGRWGRQSVGRGVGGWVSRNQRRLRWFTGGWGASSGSNLLWSRAVIAASVAARRSGVTAGGCGGIGGESGHRIPLLEWQGNSWAAAGKRGAKHACETQAGGEVESDSWRRKRWSVNAQWGTNLSTCKSPENKQQVQILCWVCFTTFTREKNTNDFGV